VQVAGGYNHSLALHSDGSIISWGWNINGQVSDTPRGTNFLQIAAGTNHSLALRTDGSIVSWGANYNGEVTNTPTSNGFVQIDGGGSNSIALIPLVGSSYCTAGISASGCLAGISATGIPSITAPNGFHLLVGSVEGAKDGMFFFGTNGQQAIPWGTGFQCVVPPVKRCGLLPGIGTANACDGTFSQDLNALWCSTCPKPQHNPGAGASVQAQFWYRDPWNTATNKGTTMSDAIEFVVEP
jgi:hypothetical protein